MEYFAIYAPSNDNIGKNLQDKCEIDRKIFIISEEIRENKNLHENDKKILTQFHNVYRS